MPAGRRFLRHFPTRSAQMEESILITGGCGFIGSHLSRELLSRGYRVRILDDLSPQVHATGIPENLLPEVEFIQGDIRDRFAVKKALEGIDGVFHLAAAVGVGQSMYEIEHYTSVNNIGTAVLLEALIKRPVKKLVVASSMSIYGEGLYRDSAGRIVPGKDRSPQQLRSGRWELTDEEGNPLFPIPTSETKEAAPASVYALSKFDQEKICLIAGRAYGIPATALRFFNVYGPEQALSNPYTGVLAIFATRILNGNRPIIFEDGRQQRDFVNVRDIARACRLAYETPEAADEVFNIGSGRSYTILEIEKSLRQALNSERIEPIISGKYRQGDIRHCVADISRAREILNFEPAVAFEEGIGEFAAWLDGQIVIDQVDAAGAELAKRGLTQ